MCAIIQNAGSIFRADPQVSRLYKIKKNKFFILIWKIRPKKALSIFI